MMGQSLGRRARTSLERLLSGLTVATCSVTSMECDIPFFLRFRNSGIPENQRHCCSNSMKPKEILSSKKGEGRY